MIDVGGKPVSARRAVAEARLRMSDAAVRAVAEGTLPKGDAAAVARVAGIMAAKRTPELVALCHPLPIDAVAVDVTVDVQLGEVRILASVGTAARTGVEMEALTAASVAALNIYDLVKSVDRDVSIALRLVEKTKAPQAE